MARTDGGLRASRVARDIREDIMAGRLEPGQRLAFTALCNQHGVSVGVMREALIRLVDHGIVRTESHLGFHVVRLSAEDLAELSIARAAMEPAWTRLAVENGSVEWEAEVLAAHHRLERAQFRAEDGSLSEEWAKAHAEFHLVLQSGCGNRRMQEITSRLRDEWDIYTRWWLGGTAFEQAEEVLADEHAAILGAALERDGALLEALLRRHIVSAEKHLAPAADVGEAADAAGVAVAGEAAEAAG